MSAVPTFKASPDFQRLSRDGRRWSASAFILQYLPKDPETPAQFGFTASRKVGNAVVRNRAKRRLRELVRLQLKEGALMGFDLVLIARTAAATQDFSTMQADFKRGLKTLGTRT